MSDDRTEQTQADMQAMVQAGQISSTFLTRVRIEPDDDDDERTMLLVEEPDILDNVMAEAEGHSVKAELHVAGTSARLAALESREDPNDIGLARARNIVQAMNVWGFAKMGFPCGPPPDLTEHSLRALLDAAHMVRDHGDVIAPDGTRSVMVVPADRMIAGLYCLHHYYPQEPGDVEPYVEGRGRGLVVVNMVEPDSEETSA